MLNTQPQKTWLILTHIVVFKHPFSERIGITLMSPLVALQMFTMLSCSIFVFGLGQINFKTP
jgi:hypothetical protein